MTHKCVRLVHFLERYIYTGCKIFPNWRAMRKLMRTIHFGKNLRLSQIQPIKTAESQIYPILKKKVKALHPV
jgi:hypothetical protein